MGRHLAQSVQELFDDCRRGQTQQVQCWIAQKGKKHKSPLSFLRHNNGTFGGPGTASGWLAGLREPSTSHTLLHLAALHGHCELARILVERDAQLVTARDRKGCAPLHLAAWNGHERLIETLLDFAPATVNAVNNAKETALHLATLNGHANVVRQLLKRHSDARLRNARMDTALDIAARTGKAHLCRLLLLHCPELAIQSASDCCPTIPARSSSNKLTPPYPLHSAARLGHTECVGALLEHGFDVDYLGQEGTPLHAAARHGQADTVRELLLRGTNPDNRDIEGQTVAEWLDNQIEKPSGGDPVMVKRWKECRRLMEAEQRRRRSDDGRRGRSREADDEKAWKSVMPGGRHRNGTLNSHQLVPISPPVASPRSLLTNGTIPHSPSRSLGSPLIRGTFSPTAFCTYQPVVNGSTTPSPTALPYTNVPKKPVLVYDNAPPPYCQKKWAHNCADGCNNEFSPAKYGDGRGSFVPIKNVSLLSQIGGGTDELGLLRLPTEDALGADSDALLSPCSTLERSPHRAQKPHLSARHCAPDAPLAIQEESVTPVPPTPERQTNFPRGHPPHHPNGVDASPPPCSGVPCGISGSSISTLALVTSSSVSSSCSLPMVSHLSPSTPTASVGIGTPLRRRSPHQHRAATTIGGAAGEFTDPSAESVGRRTIGGFSPASSSQAVSPASSSSSSSSSQQSSVSAHPLPPLPPPHHHHSSSAPCEVPTTSADVSTTEDNFARKPPSTSRVRNLVQRMEREETKIPTNGEDPNQSSPRASSADFGSRDRDEADEGTTTLGRRSQKGPTVADHDAQWKEIDEMLNAIQRDAFLINGTDGQQGCSVEHNPSPSTTSSSLYSQSNGAEPAPLYQPIVHWLRSGVGLTRHHDPQQNLQQSALQLGELLHRNGFDNVQFMKGSLNTQLMGELGIARHVQLLICRHLNDKSEPENIRSADQFEFVSDWLDSLNLLDHLGPFAKANLTSTTDLMAAHLSRTDLEKMGITQLGHIARIIRSLELATQHQKKSRPRPTNLNSAFSASPPQGNNGNDGSVPPRDNSSVSAGSNRSERSISSSKYGRATPLSPVLDMAELRTRLTNGCARFSAHYLGAAEISNVEGTEDCRRAMNAAKARVGQTADVPQVLLEVSVSGVNVRNQNADMLLHCHPIGHIQVVCQDELDLNCFAYIFQQSDRHFCHVFCVLTAIIAKEIIITLGEAFNLAYQIALQQ